MKKIIFTTVFILVIISSMFSLNAFAAEMADGTYEVNIALWHSEDDKESMAADAVGTKATIVVENGIKTMHITSGEMSMMGIKASLQELRIADKNGNFTDAKIESKNSEGNPTGFYFTMPHTDEYITVKVNPHLAIMGNKDIGARIKVDYSTLKLIKSAEAVTETKTEITVTQTEASNAITTQENESDKTTGEKYSEKTTEIADTTQSVTLTTQEQSSGNNKTVVIAIIAVAAAIVIFAAIKHKKTK